MADRPLAMPRDALAIKARLGVVAQFDSWTRISLRREPARVRRFVPAAGIAGSARIRRCWRLPRCRTRPTRAGRLSAACAGAQPLARALVNDPRLLLLDEPTTA